MTKRRPSAEESDLFRRAVGDAKPLRARAKRAGAPPAAAKEPAPRAAPISPKPSAPRIARPAPPLPRARPPAPGRFADIDKRTAERFRRGELAIEATLDLHGLIQTEAHRRLDAFIERAAAAGTRMLLVVTGKGQNGGGVLRESVPRWLAEPGLRPRVLALAHAQPKHGGGGALYVLLRKKREDRR
ncbi:MAG: Smr/MutS family protein [Dongiaceae bacterium]